MCFGAKDDQFGRFEIETGGSINAVKLVHVSGRVTCNINDDAWSRFGCWKAHHGLYIVITNSTDDILLPESQESVDSWYTLPGYYPDSKEIAFTENSTPLLLFSGQELRIWFVEDLANAGEGDNAGISCVDVFATYI